MSLLLQALQKASKNREDEEQEGTPAPDPLDSDELTLAPVGGTEPALERETGVSRSESASPAQAAAVLQARRAPAFDPMDYAREHYMIVVIALAVLVAIGYGAYVYLQVANPAWLRPKPAVVPSSPLGAAPPPPPPSSNAAAPESAAAKISGLPAGSQPAATSSAVVAAPAAMNSEPAAAAPVPPPPPRALDDRSEYQPVAAATSPSKPSRAAVARRAVQVTPVEQFDDEGVETVVLPASSRAVKAPAGVSSPPPTAPRIAPDLIAAYEALQAGDSAQAKTLYLQVLQSDSRSIDALLGLAVIASKEGRVEEAVKYYQRVLELEPRNAYAQAGLISIMGGSDPASSETRLRQLIARDPSAFLYFTLGNLYADQGQWPGAQQAYFQAFQSQPDNPDYAFNLAVGLEHLGQSRQALDYYRKALDLSFRKGRANFDQNLVIQRVGQLSSRVEQ